MISRKYDRNLGAVETRIVIPLWWKKEIYISYTDEMRPVRKCFLVAFHFGWPQQFHLRAGFFYRERRIHGKDKD
jgi:hypothetical protein